MPLFRRQRGSPSASCARLQSRQLHAHAGDAGPDQGLVADQPEGEADQNRREGRQPWPLRRIPDGRGRHPAKPFCRHRAADRGTAAAAGSRIDVKRLIVLRPIKKPKERCVWMTTKSTFSALGAPMSLAWVHESPMSRTWHCQNLSKAAISNLSRAAISASTRPSSGGCRFESLARIGHLTWHQSSAVSYLAP